MPTLRVEFFTKFHFRWLMSTVTHPFDHYSSWARSGDLGGPHHGGRGDLLCDPLAGDSEAGLHGWRQGDGVSLGGRRGVCADLGLCAGGGWCRHSWRVTAGVAPWDEPAERVGHAHPTSHDGEHRRKTMTDIETNGVSPSELASLEAAYREIRRRDGSAERKMFHWQVLAIVMVIVNVAIGV